MMFACSRHIRCLLISALLGIAAAETIADVSPVERTVNKHIRARKLQECPGNQFLLNNNKCADCGWAGKEAADRCSRLLAGGQGLVSEICPNECGNNNIQGANPNPNPGVQGAQGCPRNQFMLNNNKCVNCGWAGLEVAERCDRLLKDQHIVRQVCPGMCNNNGGQPQQINTLVQTNPPQPPPPPPGPAGVVSVVGSSWTTTQNSNTARIDVPPGTRVNDMLVMFVGGSGPGNAPMPSRPIPGAGWIKIIGMGDQDINLNVYYKVVTNNSPQRYSIQPSKNLFITLGVLRGVDANNPIVDSEIEFDTLPGLRGDALTPQVNTVKGGIVLLSVSYDDAHRATVREPGFETLETFKAATGDGMVLGASSGPTDNGTAGPIFVTSNQYADGRSEEVSTTISFRPGRVSSVANYNRAQDINKAGPIICGDGNVVIPGNTFCLIKRNYDGEKPIIISNKGKSCAFFDEEKPGFETRLRNHCTPTRTENPGAEDCAQCAQYLSP